MFTTFLDRLEDLVKQYYSVNVGEFLWWEEEDDHVFIHIVLPTDIASFGEEKV